MRSFFCATHCIPSVRQTGCVPVSTDIHPPDILSFVKRVTSYA